MSRYLKFAIALSIILVLATVFSCVSKHSVTSPHETDAVDIASNITVEENTPAELSKPEHLAIVNSRLLQTEETSGQLEETPFLIELDRNGDRVDIDTIPGGKALGLAAMYYATATLDFDVSLRDVIEYGLWPFDTIPSRVDLDDKLYDFTYMPHLLNNGDLDPEGEIGSPYWKLVAKWDVLRYFYEDYFRYNFKYREVLSGTGAAEFYSPSDLNDQRRAVRELHVDLSYPLDEVPVMVPEFWINDVSGEPMQLSTGKKGDFALETLSDLLHIKYPSISLKEDITVPQILLHDYTAETYPVIFIDGFSNDQAEELDKETSGLEEELCCFYVMVGLTITTNGVLTGDYDCICNGCGKILCYCEYDLGWFGSMAYNDWQLVAILPCDTDVQEIIEAFNLPPGSSICARTQGSRAPDTMYQYTGTCWIMSVTCVPNDEHTYDCLMAQDCELELWNLLNALCTSANKFGTIPGDVCMVNGYNPEPDAKRARSCCKPRE